MKIFNDGILVAESINNKVVLKDVPEELVPVELFGFKVDRVNEVSMEMFNKYLSKRVTSRNYQDIDVFLKKLGLTKYDVNKIIKATEGRTNYDEISIIL